jgi:hypothetical protein
MPSNLTHQNSTGRSISYYSVKDAIPETIPEEDENKRSMDTVKFGKGSMDGSAQYGKYL